MVIKKLLLGLLFITILFFGFHAATQVSQASFINSGSKSEYRANGFIVTYHDKSKIKSFSGGDWKAPKPVKGTEYYVIESLVDSTVEDIKLQATQVIKDDKNIKTIQPNFIYKPFFTPNDTNYTSQWALNNTGQSGGLVGFDLDAEKLWEFENPSDGTITVAVIDTGVDITHPDLLNNLVTGWDFTDNDNYAYDFEGHGTHVAGIIAAETNNSTGISGLSRHNLIKVMPLKVNFSSAQIISAIQFAIDNNIPVINASWGGSFFDTAMYNKISQYPGLFVAAAGNGNASGIGYNIDTNPVYPASYNLDNIIAVGSYTRNGTRSTFSNFGLTVDVYAPGSSIRSTYPVHVPLVNDDFEDSPIAVGLSNSDFAVTNGTWSVISSSCSAGFACGTRGLAAGNNRAYVNNANDIVTLITPINTSTFAEPVRFSFYINAEIEYHATCSNDYLAVEVDNNDNNWVQLARICGSWDDNLLIHNDISGTALRVRFRWVTNGSTTGIAPYLDNIKILSSSSVTHTYADMSGTSMATPYVVATIAQMKINKSNITNSDVKDLLVKTMQSSIVNSFDATVSTDAVFGNWSQTAGVASTNIYGLAVDTNFYQATVGTNNRLYIRQRDNLSAWPRWEIVTSYTDAAPAMDYFDGCFYQSVKGGNNKIYNRRSCGNYSSWTSWTENGGYTPSAATMASANGRLYQSVRGGNDKIYNRYTTDGLVWSTWTLDGGLSGHSPQLMKYNNEIYQAVIGLNTTDVFVRKLNSSFVWSAWENIGGAASTPITMQEYSGRLYISYANPKKSAIMIRSFAPATGWTNELSLSGSTIDRPNLITFDGKLYQYALGGGGTLYERITK